MIKVENLHKSFDGHEVLKGISFEVKRGQVVALIGGSGDGKSVLLKHVAGLMRPDEGRVTIDGKEIGRLRGSELSELRTRLGFLFQGGALFDSMSIFDNVAFPLKEKTRLSDELIGEKAMEELKHVGLSGSEQKYPSQLSGGMVKRAALARALVTEPEIMLFDEPTTGLDPVRGGVILRLIASCHQRLSFTGILVTHEIPRVFDIVDKVFMLHDGVVWAQGTGDALINSEDPVVREFIGETVRSPVQGEDEAFEAEEGVH